MKKYLRLISLLMLVAMLMVGCADAGTELADTSDLATETPADTSDGGQAEDTDPSEEDDDTNKPSDKDISDGLAVASARKSDYMIIRPVSVTADMATEIQNFTSYFSEVTGANIYSDFDSSPARSDKEIVINGSSNRDDVVEAMNETSYTSCNVRVSGNRIIITAYSGTLLKKALRFVEDNLAEQGGTWYLPKDMEYSYDAGFAKDVPKYTAGKLQGVYYCGQKNYEISTERTTLDEVNAYIASLKSEGFTEYTTNVNGETGRENHFWTLRSDDSTVHISWYYAMKVCKIIIADPLQYIPSTTKPEYDRVVTSTIAQTARDGAGQTAPGLSMIVQLADASFIIIDGGPYDEGDCDALLKYMQDRTPNGAKPVISAWMITHAHGDHMNLANEFLTKHHKSVEVKMAAYNFPDFDTLYVPNETMTGGTSNAFISKIKNYYHEAEHYIFHAGQKLYLADAEIEILFTHEDLYPKEASWGNHTSSIWTITVNGKKLSHGTGIAILIRRA